MAGFTSVDEEVSDRRLRVEGSIPGWLEGSLLRNGPGAFEIGGERVRHWFDGLAMLRRYRFDDGEVRYSNRFLRSETYAEAQEGRVTGQFGTDDGGLGATLGFLRRLGPPVPTDNANVHVAHIDGDGVALTEVPRWVRFDRETLATRGELRFDDDISLHMTTAHLSVDPATGDHVGVGLSFGRSHEYVVYRIPAESRRRERFATIPANPPAYVHDCGLTASKVVLVETPLRISVLRALSPFTEGFLDLLDWQPDRGTTILVVDRESGAVERASAPPSFVFHVANAYDDGEDIVVDLVTYEDADIVDALSFETLAAGSFDDVPPGRLVRYRLGDGGVSTRRLYDGELEMPVVVPEARAAEHRYVYGQATGRSGMNGIAKVDTSDGSAREWWAEGVYAEEPRVVRRPAAATEDEGLVLAPALDTEADESILLVLDAETLAERARARLPHRQPFGFHGRFLPEDDTPPSAGT